MQVSIEYCTQWDYSGLAAGLAEQLKQRFGAEVELIESRGGAYEITIDGELFFSKNLTGHFPNEERLLKELEGYL